MIDTNIRGSVDITYLGKKGKVSVTGLDDRSNSVYMPIQMAYQVIPEKTNDIYDTLLIKIKDENQLDEAITKIQDKLMISRNVTRNKMDFSVSSRKEMQQTRADTMNSMKRPKKLG